MEVAIQKIQKQTTKTQEQLIMRIYKQAFEQSWSEYMDIIGRGKIPPNGFLDKTKLAYINQLYTQLQTQSAICNENIPKRILNEYAEIAKKISNNAEFNKMIDKSVNIVSKDIVAQMIQGQVYKDGKGLDSRLWSSVNVAGQKIEDAITSCLARGIGSAEASKIITQFANTGHHTWDRKKIREKLGDGYASKYGTGGLDYEALRLMRTTTTHMAQLSAINSHKVNPYSNYVIYHIGHAGARTCSMCRDRDGKKYKLEEVPLDHPNGLCWLEPFMSLDGKSPATLADLMDDMNDYYDGKPNSGIMDKWAKENGVAPVKPQKEKKPTLPKGHLYTEEQREAKYKELETILTDSISTMIKDEYGSNINVKGLTKSTVMGIIDNLQQYPTPIQDLYLHMGKELQMRYKDGGACYRPTAKAIFFSVKATRSDERGAYGTVFHEWGHLIDNQLIEGKRLTRDIKEEMHKILKKDVENQIKYHVNNSNVDKRGARKIIKNELWNAPDAIAGVSDIYGGLTGNQVMGAWGHNRSYWNRRDVKAEVCSEAWADILQSYGIPDQRKYMDKYLPGGKAYVEKTVEELIEKIKKGEI